METLGELLDKYIKATGQKEQYIFSGSCQYGPGFIEVLVEECVRDNKKIVWTRAPLIDGEDHGFQNYKLVPIIKRPGRKADPAKK